MHVGLAGAVFPQEVDTRRLPASALDSNEALALKPPDRVAHPASSSTHGIVEVEKCSPRSGRKNRVVGRGGGDPQAAEEYLESDSPTPATAKHPGKGRRCFRIIRTSSNH